MLSLMASYSPLVASFQKGVDVVALTYLIFLFPIPFFWLLIHPAIHFWRRFGNRAFWVALPVWVAIRAAVLLLRAQLFQQRIHRDAVTWLLGLALLVLAHWVERRTRREIGVRRLVGLPEINPGHYLNGVVRTGVYACVRHPRYAQYMLTLLSLGLLTGARGVFLLAIINILLYQVVAPLEERELLDHYGAQYAAYARAVPRFVPRVWQKTEPQISS